MRPNSQDAVREFRPYFDNAPVYGHGPSLEEFTGETPLTVGSPQQVIDRTLGFREYVGDYQRQLFLIDHAGLPLKTVLEQLDLLGEEVVPVLRKEFDALRPAHVPDAPTHASLVAAAAAPDSTVHAVDDVTGKAPEEPDDPADPGRRLGRAEPALVHPAARRPARRGDPRRVGRRGAEVELTVVELRDHAHDIVNNLLTGFPPAALREAARRGRPAPTG